MSEKEVISGEIYLERASYSLGFGETAKEGESDNFWVAVQRPDGTIKVMLLDMYDQPSGLAEIVEPEEFNKRFALQPGYNLRRTTPKELTLNRILEMAEAHFRAGEYNSAEYEYESALKLDEKSVRANFGIGLTYFAQNEIEKALQVFQRLAAIEGAYDPSHKHLFNEFGIQLREHGLFAEAIEHYHRALTVSRADEHLWFNIGRCLTEAGRPEEGVRMLEKALRLNPRFRIAKQYLKSYLGEEVPDAVDLDLF